jgi:hypothetical protein
MKLRPAAKLSLTSRLHFSRRDFLGDALISGQSILNAIGFKEVRQLEELVMENGEKWMRLKRVP